MGITALSSASLHHAILSHVVEHGYAPKRAALAAQFGVDDQAMAAALRALAAGHGVVLHPDQAEVWVIHSFSTAPTLFSVRKGERLWWGNCDWCSLGVAALLGGDGITIDTMLGAEGQPATVHIDHGQVRENLWVHFPVPMTRAWDNVIYTCSTMLLFESEAAIDHWARRHNIARGDAQPIQRVYDFAAVWYGRHLAADWKKWTVAEARAIFERFGLKGPIWDMPESGERF